MTSGNKGNNFLNELSMGFIAWRKVFFEGWLAMKILSNYDIAHG